MNYYYLDANSQPAGPLPLDEIKAQVADGTIPSNPLVAAVGTSKWQPITGGPPAAGFRFDTFVSDKVGGVLRTARYALSESFLQKSLGLMERFGHITVLLGGAAGLVYIIYTAARSGSWLGIGGGLVLIVGLFCAQYAARRFFSANESLFTPTKMASPALLDCLALLALFATVAVLLGSITACIRVGIWQPLLPALLLAAMWVYFATIALHPETVKIGIAPHGAGEEIVELVAFLLKAMLKLLPLFFLAWSALGCLVIVLSFFDLGENVMNVVQHSLLPLPRGFRVSSDSLGLQGIGLVIAACLMVPFAHLLFLAVSLPLDLWRALLSVPAKLDALKK